MLRDAASTLTRPLGVAIVLMGGLLAWGVSGWLAERYGGTRRSAAWFVVVIALAVAVTVAPDGREIAPFEWAGRGYLVDQITDAASWTTALSGVISTGERLANVALFLPVGFFGFAVLRSTFKALAFGVLLSAGIEMVQTWGERSGDLNDLVSNTLGTGLGALAAMVLVHLLRRGPRPVGAQGTLAGWSHSSGAAAVRKRRCRRARSTG